MGAYNELLFETTINCIRHDLVIIEDILKSLLIEEEKIE